MDWSMEDIVLRVEEDEDDLLAILEGNEVVVEKPPQKDLVEEKDNERGSDLMAEIDQIKEFIIESVKEEQGEIITLNDSFEEGKSDEVEPAVTSISIETAEIVCLLENESQGTGTDIVVIPVECKEDSDKEDVISLCGSNIEDPDDMFVIPANSEYEDTEQVVNQMDVPKDTELEKGEGVISSTTDIDNATSQPSQESVEFWVCPVCGANLIDSEMYRDHLQWHLTEDVSFSLHSLSNPHITMTSLLPFSGAKDPDPHPVEEKEASPRSSGSREAEGGPLPPNSDEQLELSLVRRHPLE